MNVRVESTVNLLSGFLLSQYIFSSFLSRNHSSVESLMFQLLFVSPWKHLYYQATT